MPIQPPQYVNIQSNGSNGYPRKYFVACEDWPNGMVSVQTNYKTPNGVWALVAGDEGSPASFYRLIDLKHGLQLCDPVVWGGGNLPKQMPPYISSFNDDRGKWKKETKPTPPSEGYEALNNVFGNNYLYMPNATSVEVGRPQDGHGVYVWTLQQAESGYFPIARLPITGKQQVIAWGVDLASKPDGHFGTVANDAVVATLYDALRKWIEAFNKAGGKVGAKLSLSPAEPGGPAAPISGCIHISFGWGDVPDGEAGHVSVGGTGDFWNHSGGSGSASC